MIDLVWQAISFISFFFFLYLAVRLLASLMFWWYLWQRKEYRWDRLLAHLSLSQGRRQVINNTLNPFMFDLRKPRLTLRLFLIAGLTLAFEYQIYFWLLRFLSRWVKEWSILLFPVFGIALLITFWLTPLVVGLVNGLVSLLFRPFSELVIWLAKKKLATVKPLVIGITGSFGKSTTKEILRQILVVKFKVVATQGSVNTPLGVAKTILRQLNGTHEVFIVEMGAYKVGEIRLLAKMVKPKIGIITGINPQHRQLFGSQEKIAQAKYELIEALPRIGLAVFNGENKITQALAKKTKKVKVKQYTYPGKPYQTELLGKFQQLNIQAALIVADYLGVDRTKALEAVENLELFGVSLQLKRGRAGCLVLDDSRNSNPDGFWEALEALKEAKGKTKIVVTAGVVELGTIAPAVHLRLGKKIAQVADELVLTSDNFVKEFKKGAGQEFQDKIKLKVSPAALGEHLKNQAHAGVTILLEGWNWQAKKILLKKAKSGN